MKDFNHFLNINGRDKRFARWQEYRDAITTFILEHSSSKKIKNMIVLGAGNCQDLDLKKLENTGCKITLTDIDEEALKYGVKSQGVEKGDFRLKGSDYLSGPIDENGLYDLVVCMPIYTQLYFPMHYQGLMVAYDQGKIDSETLILKQRELLDGMPAIIGDFNESMMALMKDRSKLIVFSDLIEDEPKGHYIEAFGSEMSYDAIINDYVEIYGMGLGNYGLYHLEQRLNVLAHDWFLWSFNENRSMVVKGAVFEK